jgi:hypothetical protein
VLQAFHHVDLALNVDLLVSHGVPVFVPHNLQAFELWVANPCQEKLVCD